MFKVDRKPELKVGGQLHLSWNWHLYLQLKAKSVKVKKCGGKRRMEERGKWFDYLYLSHSTIHNAGLGLFAVCELLTRTLIGYYCSVLIWHSSLKLSYNEHVEIELLDELTDAFSILMWDSTGQWVTVSPGSCGDPSLYMGFQFMNDVGLSFDDQMDNQSQVCHVMYNMQITEDGCVYTTRMVAKGMELLCTYVEEQMIPKQEQENFVEVCSQHVQARYGETRPKKFITLSNKYSRKGEGGVSRNRKP